MVWAGVHGVASLTILGALDRSVAAAGGDADRVHLTALMQDLMGLPQPSPTPLGGEP